MVGLERLSDVSTLKWLWLLIKDFWLSWSFETLVSSNHSEPPGCSFTKLLKSYKPPWILQRPSAPSCSRFISNQRCVECSGWSRNLEYLNPKLDFLASSSSMATFSLACIKKYFQAQTDAVYFQMFAKQTRCEMQCIKMCNANTHIHYFEQGWIFVYNRAGFGIFSLFVACGLMRKRVVSWWNWWNAVHVADR